MAQITFDPSQQSTIWFRCARNGSKKFVFKNTDGTPFSLSGKTFAAFIKETSHSTAVKISLNTVIGGAGNNELTVSITSAQSNIKAKDYYFELWDTTAKITYINGISPFTNGVFDGVDDSVDNITIQLSGGDVQIYISNGGGSSTDLVFAI